MALCTPTAASVIIVRVRMSDSMASNNVKVNQRVSQQEVNSNHVLLYWSTMSISKQPSNHNHTLSFPAPTQAQLG